MMAVELEHDLAPNGQLLQLKLVSSKYVPYKHYEHFSIPFEIVHFLHL